MTSPVFNLIDEPWLSVQDLDGQSHDISLRRVFHEAESIRRLSGESSTMPFAHLRLLLAILYRAAQGPCDLDQWVALHDHWDDTVARIDDYLDRWHERFWLHHPTQPFMQVADLIPMGRAASGVKQIMLDGFGNQAGTLSQESHQAQMSAAEAARWLVHLHAFDLSGIRGAAVGDPRAIRGKCYPIGPGAAGQIGGVFLSGETLRDTLLLNLVRNPRVATDLPVWERHPLGPMPEGWDSSTVDGQYRRPTGPADLYTWQSRRVLLFGDGGVVDDAIVMLGDAIDTTKLDDIEPMTGWHTKATPQGTVTRPVYHAAGRSIWRQLPGLLPGTTLTTDATAWQAPAILEWMSQTVSRGFLTVPSIAVTITGVDYGPNQSRVTDIIDDTIILPTFLLDTNHVSTVRMVERAVNASTAAVAAYAEYAGNLARAAGAADSAGPRRTAVMGLWTILDDPFRRWVAAVDSRGDLHESEDLWNATLKSLVNGEAADHPVSVAAIKGRVVDGRYLDTGIAERYFRAHLRKIRPQEDN